MGDESKTFFAEHPTIGDVPLDSRIRVATTLLSAAELAVVKNNGHVDATVLEQAELVVGGVVVARGTIVEEDGNTVFQVEVVQ